MVWSLSRVWRRSFSLIVGCGELVFDLRHQRQNFVNRRAKHNSQSVVADFQRRLRVNSPGAKHVVCVQDQLLVQVNSGVSVEALEDELHILSFERRRSNSESRPVFPISLADPLLLLFVVAIKGILDQFVCEQIGVNAAGHGRVVPISFSDLTKLPSGVNAHDCLTCFRCEVS